MAGEEERISWETKIKGWKGDSEGRVRKWGTARIDCGSDKKRRARVYSVRSETGKRLFSLEAAAIQLRNHGRARM